jgi:hypothetical protein
MRLGSQVAHPLVSTRSASNPQFKIHRLHGLDHNIVSNSQKMPVLGSISIVDRPDFKISNRNLSWSRVQSKEPLRPPQIDQISSMSTEPNRKHLLNPIVSERLFISHDCSEMNNGEISIDKSRGFLEGSSSPKSNKAKFEAMLADSANALDLSMKAMKTQASQPLRAKKPSPIFEKPILRPKLDGKRMAIKESGLKGSFLMGKHRLEQSIHSSSISMADAPQITSGSNSPTDKPPTAVISSRPARGDYYYPAILDFISKVESGQAVPLEIRNHFKELFEVLTKLEEYSPSKFIRLEPLATRDISAFTQLQESINKQSGDISFVPKKKLTLILDIDETLVIALKQRPSKNDPKYHTIEVLQGSEEVKVVCHLI